MVAEFEERQENVIKLNNNAFRTTGRFKYLGGEIASDSTAEDCKDIAKRLKKGGKLFQNMKYLYLRHGH